MVSTERSAAPMLPDVDSPSLEAKVAMLLWALTSNSGRTRFIACSDLKIVTLN
uniref:Uncharacterized protein n=1 Tax=Rhizophora mucronata TaxID=61149 RepID=A0A2P2JDM4_RHIMU